MFVGRTAELALLGAELRAAGGGCARRVLIEGPEGIGKTALVHHTLGGEASVRVLAASGEEGERRLALGVVRQLADEITRMNDAAGGEPEGLREADPCAAGQAICDVIGALQAHGPVAVVIDDAQWADRPSLHALGYLLRRLRAGRVLVVIICRDLSDPWLPEGLRRILSGNGTLHLTLGGLGVPELTELSGMVGLAGSAGLVGSSGLAGLSGPAGVAEVAGPPAPNRADAPRELDEEAAERLREHTLGNPLHARNLLATMPLPALADPGVRLPAPGTYRRPYARRLRGCTPAARRLVAACAVLGRPCPLHVAAAVAGGFGEPLNALEETVAAGLLRELPDRLIDFPEPLARAAAYDELGPGTRARLHLAAAALAGDPGTALRHRAAAAGGPDDELAEELAGYAAKAAQHGQWLEAAAHLALAAGLAEPGRSRARRDELRTAMLEHVLNGGDVLHAARIAAALRASGPDPQADPDPARQYVLGRLALVSGRLDEASELLTDAWRHREPGFAADVAEQLAWLNLITGDRAASVRWARLAIEQPVQSSVGRPYDVLALGGSPGAGTPPGSLAAAVAQLRRDAPEEACTVLRQAVAAADKAGLPHHRLLATALLAAAEHACARWEDAAARAERALSEATALGQRWLLPCLEAVCVAPLAARGWHERALAHATAARTAARSMRHALGERQADLAMSLPGMGDATVAAGAGHPKRCSAKGAGHLSAKGRKGVVRSSAEAGARVVALRGGGTDGPPDGGDAFVPDLFVPDPRPRRIEALVAGGELEAAEHALTALDRSCARGDDGAQVVAQLGARREAERIRLGALLLAARNVPAQAEESLGRALTLVEGGVCALEEARVLLDLGRLQRRTGRRRAAAERLGAARAIFERLGARPLVDRCAQELEACGLEPQATVRLGLTPQELSTATLVAHGLTNRQIATELLISVKTVEYHIGKIYTKLGISSRVALAALVATEGGAA